MLSGWDWNPQSSSREGSGSLGMMKFHSTYFRVKKIAPVIPSRFKLRFMIFFSGPQMSPHEETGGSPGTHLVGGRLLLSSLAGCPIKGVQVLY